MLVLYDSQCSLCRSLASFLSQRFNSTINFQSWHSFIAQPPKEFLEKFGPTVSLLISDQNLDSLKVWTGEVLLSGEDSWLFLLQMDPSLKALNWLAKKLKLQKEISQTLNFVGHITRKVCLRCR